MNWEYIFSPQTLHSISSQLSRHGTLVAGMLFGAAWAFLGDAIATSQTKIPNELYLPGALATVALVMINCIRREDLQESDPFDDAGYCRPRFWLFVSYLVSFASVVAAVWVLIACFTSNPELSAEERWPGAAGILQVVCILGSGLLLFVSRSPSEDAAGYAGYGAF
ncbi:hypothetical protein V8C86DRAFT_2975444 [Haematococcus lacustris]